MEEPSGVDGDVALEVQTPLPPTVHYDPKGQVLVINHKTSSWKIDRNSFDVICCEKKEEFGGIGGMLANSDISPNAVPEPGVTIAQPDDFQTEAQSCGNNLEAVGDAASDCMLQSGSKLVVTAVGAIGVVFGDLGASPLYTTQSIFTNLDPTPENAIGATSALFWLLNIVVTLKYVSIIMRVDNKGEGGIMALCALASQSTHGLSRAWWKTATMSLGMFGASCFFGDSIITPAISVMSALEGLAVVTPTLTGKTMPIAVVVLLLLFFIQRYGTGKVGHLFGPIMLLWFFMIGVGGIQQIVLEPSIFAALNPARAVSFLQSQSGGQGGQGIFLALGNIVLAVTGGEALYADMGHFGARPIRLAWLFVVLPGVTLSYLGQGALIIRDPTTAYSPFYLQFPSKFLVPSVILSTLATVIASQSVIAGSFSMMNQAIKLGFVPRMDIHHMSADKRGQIYIPLVNFIMMVGVITVTAGFGSANSLTSAFGMSVTMTMTIDGLLTYFVVSRSLTKKGWHKVLVPLLMLMSSLFVLDILLVASCSLKFLQGAWLPLAVATILFIVMTTWSRGGDLVKLIVSRDRPPLEPFVGWLSQEPIPRIKRTGVYMVANTTTVPQALLHNLKHSQNVAELCLFLQVLVEEEPTVAPEKQIDLLNLAPGFWRVQLRYGFKDHADIPKAVARLHTVGLPVDPGLASYYLSRSIVVPRAASLLRFCCFVDMTLWRKVLFCIMHRNASSAADYFCLPDDAVTLGSRVHI